MPQPLPKAGPLCIESGASETTDASIRDTLAYMKKLMAKEYNPLHRGGAAKKQIPISMTDTGYTLADAGHSDWGIVIGADASPAEVYAAEELHRVFLEVSGAKLPIQRNPSELAPHTVFVGHSEFVDRLGISIDWSRLGDEGFVIQTHRDCLVIAGGALRGTLYGVYTFLEDYLGCRWFSSTVSYIPTHSTIEIPTIDAEQIPVLEYRDVFYADAFDPDWCARIKCNGNTPALEGKHGGKVKYSHFVHTFNSLVPIKGYFESHPEYFSEINGKRTAERWVSQLCLTNPDVLQISIDRVKEWIAADPDASIISVSQNDGGGQHGGCQCESCRALDEQEGSHSGSLLWFVNKVAEAIGEDCPQIAIDTLAYRYTRRPPKTIRPEPNVIVRLCSIECCFSHPMETCSEENDGDRRSTFSQDLKDWASVCQRLYVWDYVTNFANYVMPFPNLRVLQPNIQFMVANNVKGIFEEGDYSEGGGGEFAELRAYLLAKLLWNPDCDVNKVMNEFLTGYYGEAGPIIREYIDMVHDHIEEGGFHIGIYDPPTAPYFTQELLARANSLFDQAEAVADNQEILQRVQTARLPVTFVQLHRMPAADPQRQEAVDAFFTALRNRGVTRIKESITLDESYKRVSQGNVKTF